MTKIGYLEADWTKISSIDKTTLSDGEGSFEDNEGFYQGDDNPEFYNIAPPGYPPLPSGLRIERKTQSEIDTIIAARAQAQADYNQKHVDADGEIAGSPFRNLTFTQVENWIENNVTDLDSAKVALKHLARAVLAIWKRQDWSE